MADPRYEKLADILVNYSCAVQPGEAVLVEAFDIPETFVRSLIRTIDGAGGRPIVSLRSMAVMRDLMLCSSDEQMSLIGEVDAYRMSKVQAYIGARGNPNVSEWSDVPPEKMRRYQSLWWQPAHRDLRVEKTRWVVIRWPSPSMAQQAEMSTEQFEDFYFRVCTMDYARMSRAMKPLKELMESTDGVRLVAPGTDLTFSIRGIPAIGCDGDRNIPDGEVFTAPVRDSIQGEIAFNMPTIYQGVTHRDVRLSFRDGKVVEAASTDPTHLEAVLDSDDGARYVGEFALGFNPHITEPMKDILFDEKMAGSIHLTPGNAYQTADNGNKSDVHWDMVLSMTPENGGGDVYFDDKLIRRAGRFVIPELEDLNPERLTA
ncbi:MAG: aminopeptidase [bacterium]|nr:aminopeptidase [bacterium]